MKTKQDTAQHTPTPWKWTKDGEFTTERGIYIGEVGTIDGTRQINAAFIVRAVNAHEELLEAAKAMQAEIRRRVGFTATAWDDAIARAEGCP